MIFDLGLRVWITKTERKVFMGQTAQGKRIFKSLQVKVSHLSRCQKHSVHGWPEMKGAEKILDEDPSFVQP